MPDAGASGASAGDLLGCGALLPGCVSGSTQEHRQTAVCPGSIFTELAQKVQTSDVIHSHSSSTGVKFLSVT